MSNFLVTLPSKGNMPQAKELFHQGVQFAKQVRQVEPTRVLEMDWVSVATFPRLNGSLCPLAVDSESQDWVLVSGTWFHQSGWGIGEEMRLLSRLQEIGPEKVAQELEGVFRSCFRE